jgi:lipoprotein-anchoring transpeptidase ErfK/SrfK
MTLLVLVTTAALSAPVPAAGPGQPPRPGPNPAAQASAPLPEGLTVQVALDRAGFSPGVIDGHMGPISRRALEDYKRQHGGDPPGVEPLASYTITPADTEGPFVPEIPKDLVQQGTLDSLAYTSVRESLAERFHTTPAFLQQLNPGATFAAGERIQVPNVEPFVAPVEKPEFSQAAEAAAPARAGERPTGTTGRKTGPPQPNTIDARPDVVVTVSRSASALTVKDTGGRIVFRAPVTTGSEYDPLPIGEWKVNGLQFNPVFNYNPDLFWDADPTHSKAKLPSGPNNPVGLVWIDLSKEHYGIHGTPEPASIGRAESHGCVRLTNWDALKLAGMVKPGTTVIFTE